jgi:hypothetical protein
MQIEYKLQLCSDTNNSYPTDTIVITDDPNRDLVWVEISDYERTMGVRREDFLMMLRGLLAMK